LSSEELVRSLREDVLPHIDTHPDSAGAYIDHSDLPMLVIRLLGDATTTRDFIEDLHTVPYTQLRSEEVDFDETDLQKAADYILLHRPLLDGVSVHAVDVDLANQHVIVRVNDDDTEQPSAVAAAITSELGGISVKFEQGLAEVDAACSSRTNCHSPHRAGIQINRGSGTGPRCTMGFHITYGGDRQFLSAGHCSYGSRSNYWYHPGSGYIGVVRENLMYAEDDLMRVSMSNSQASSTIYAQSGSVTGWDSPLQGATVRASLGASTATRSGIVQYAYTTWWSNTCNCQMRGGRATGLDPIAGDSGSPVYEVAGTALTAIGIVNTTGGAFARVDFAMNHWSSTSIP
jgi:hypothetical protein